MPSPPTKPESSHLLVCNCQRTMEIDGVRLADALGRGEPLTVASELCRSQVGIFESALGRQGRLMVACTQEAPLFAELADGKDRADLDFVNIREQAGWSEAKGGALPKMAALIAEAGYRSKPTGVMTLKSQGQCLIFGKGQQALEVAMELAARLSVTLLLADPGDALPPGVANVPIYRGRIVKATGHLGAFEIEVDGYAQLLPSSRREMAFTPPRDGARSACEIILDLSGGAPLFGKGRKRDGYVAADPANPAAVARAMLAVSDLVGEFEKPLYVDYDAGICAHSRSKKVGCHKCLDHCPTGAIGPDGDHVAIDPAICGGCGNCSAVCPTGAAGYAYPVREDVIGSAQVLVDTYRKAGGRTPALLLHEAKHGGDLIAASSRYGRGLPAHVLPLGFYAVTSLGHDLLLAMIASGAERLVILADPQKRDELPALEGEVTLARAFLDGLGLDAGRIELREEADPDALEEALWAPVSTASLYATGFVAVGGKRQIARAAIARLNEMAPAPREVIALPAGAPYGRIAVETAGCTLCLACVGACPANALHDNPDKPELSFTEAACVQCGLCAATCPEKVITLEPRFDFASAALSPARLKEEEPFHCIRCAKPFAAKSSIERVLARLEGKHAMFKSGAQADLIRMCGDCRVVALAESGGDPFAGAARPRVRTTDDYVEAEAQAKKTGRKPEDFLS
jgi:ferredoxin